MHPSNTFVQAFKILLETWYGIWYSSSNNRLFCKFWVLYHVNAKLIFLGDHGVWLGLFYHTRVRELIIFNIIIIIRCAIFSWTLRFWTFTHVMLEHGSSSVILWTIQIFDHLQHPSLLIFKSFSYTIGPFNNLIFIIIFFGQGRQSVNGVHRSIILLTHLTPS